MKQLLPAVLRRVEVLLFLLLFGTYAYFYQATGHNEAARFDQMRALAYDHTFAIDKYWWNSADVIHYPRDGKTHVYPNKAPGGTFIGLLPYFYFSQAFGFLQEIGVPEWVPWELAAYFTVLATTSALSALAAVATYYLVAHMSGDRFAAALAVLAIWLGTLCLPYATLFFSHQLVASLLILGFVLLRRAEQSADSSGDFLSFLGGLLLGFAVITEYPTALLAALVSVYYAVSVATSPRVTSAKIRNIAALLVGGLLPGLLLLGYNIAAFGKVAYVPIEAYAAKGTPFETYKHGLLGFQWRGFAALWNALSSVTVRPKIGMLYIGFERWAVYACSPVLWLVLPGLVLMLLRRGDRGDCLFVCCAIAVYLLFVTSYGSSEYDWAGGSYFGSRHLVPLLPFLAVPLAFAASRFRIAFSLLLALSAFYVLLGTAVEPRLSYPAINPARDILLPEFLRGHLAQNPSSLFGGTGHYFTTDSVAFNWAKLLRVQGRHQLVPLMVFWAVVGGALLVIAKDEAVARMPWSSTVAWLNRFRVPRATPAIAVAAFCSCVMAAPIGYHAFVAPARHGKQGLIGRYYHNNNWSGKPADIHVDRTIDFDWSQTMPFQPPFTVEWQGAIVIDEPGVYTFSLAADDGALLAIDGKTVVDVLHGPVFQRRSATTRLSKGEHALQVRYINAMFGGSVRLWWRHATRPDQIIPQDVLLPRSPAGSRQPARK